MSTSTPPADRVIVAARRTRFTRPVTAYVVSGRIGVPGVVTPIRTATNTAGAPIPVPLGQSIAITPNEQDRLRPQWHLRDCDADPDRHQHRRAADPGRQAALRHRDHAERQDRLRR